MKKFISRSALVVSTASFFAMGFSALAQTATNTPPAVPKWDTSVSLGLTLTRGNSDTEVFTAQILSDKKKDGHEFHLGADGSYGKNDGVKNNETLHGFAQYNRLFTERAYGYARFDALHDAIADVEYRLTLSPGVGYYFIKRPMTSLNGEFGPGFVYEKQGDHTEGYITLRFAEKFEHKFNERSKFWQSVEILPQVDNFDNTLIKSEIGIETAITGNFSLRAYIQDTYDTEPAPGREKNDLKLVAAIAYKF